MTAGPSRSSAWAVLAAAVAVLSGGLLTDAAGRLLALPAAAALVGLAARDLLQRQVLRADASGVELVVGLRRRRADWSEVERLRLVTDRRTPLLELDLGETVVVLSRRRLGRAPYVVLEELEALREGSGLQG